MNRCGTMHRTYPSFIFDFIIASWYMYFMESGRDKKMNIVYNDKTDLLYIRLDDRKQNTINRRVSEDIVLDIGEGNRIAGIEILDASRHVTLDRLLSIKYEVSKT